jgi:hypothetical protein
MTYNAESVKEPQQQNLVFLLLNAMLQKLNGAKNPQYGKKLLNFYLVVHSLSPKASEFVTANLEGVSKRQIQRISTKRRQAPVIHLTNEEMIAAVEKHIQLIRNQLKNPNVRIAFSVGVDATTVIGKAFQYLPSQNVVIGGAYPND